MHLGARHPGDGSRFSGGDGGDVPRHVVKGLPILSIIGHVIGHVTHHVRSPGDDNRSIAQDGSSWVCYRVCARLAAVVSGWQNHVVEHVEVSIV